MKPGILLVDDERAVLDGYRRVLADEFDVWCATSAAEAVATLERGARVVAVVSDLLMPGTGGLALLERVKRLRPAAARMLLSGHVNRDAALQAVNEVGVFRILDKPCDSGVLRAALRAAIADAAVRDTHVPASDTLDDTCGLPRRAAFQAAISALLAADPSHASALVCCVRIDQQARVTEALGHQSGDALLREATQRLRDEVGDDGHVARIDGAHFGVLVPRPRNPNPVETANVLLDSLASLRFRRDDSVFAVTASIGVVSHLDHATTAEAVVRQSYAACRVASGQGGNRVQLYDPRDSELEQRQSDLAWAGRVTMALEGDRLHLARQAIVAARGPAGAPQRYELLLRMIDERGCQVMPGKFLPAAERHRLTPALDRWVVRHALRYMTTPAAGNAAYSINLSGLSLAERTMLPYVLGEMEASGVDPARLCFEITETAAIEHMERALRLIHELRRQGCRFALDDFGSGLCSFRYLKELPVDIVKIDGSFVVGIRNDSRDEAVVRSICGIAKAFGKETVAEFVSDDAVRHVVARIGVDWVQGYGVGMPELVGAPTQGIRLSA